MEKKKWSANSIAHLLVRHARFVNDDIVWIEDSPHQPTILVL